MKKIYIKYIQGQEEYEEVLLADDLEAAISDEVEWLLLDNAEVIEIKISED